MAQQKSKTTLATTVYQRQRAEIIHGPLRPGERLRIEALADRFEVGNNAVREALSRLSSEHLVDRHDQRGFAVSSFSLGDWRVLVESRIFLETNVLRSSMRNRTESWEEEVALAFHRLTRTRRETAETPGEWEEAHRAFHRALLANAESHWLLSFCEVLADQAARYIAISNTEHVITRDAQAEHEALMKAVLYGSEDEACDLLAKHYTMTLRNLEGQFLSEPASLD